MKSIATLLLLTTVLNVYAQRYPVPYRKGNLWGYADSTGQIIIKPKYQKAGQFFHGLAWVMKDSVYYYIQPNGKKAFSKKFKKAEDFSKYGLASIKRLNKDNYELMNTRGKIGFAPVQGDDVKSTNRFDIKKLPGLKFDSTTRQFSFKAIVGNDSVEIIPDKFLTFTTPASGNPRAVEHATVVIDGKCGVVNTRGQLLIPITYDKIGPREDLHFQVQLNNKWAYFDKSGNQLTPFAFDQVSNFCNGDYPSTYKCDDYAIVKIAGKVGYIDTKGKVFIAADYEYASPFRDNIARVSLDGNIGYINKVGKRFFED